MDSIVWRTLYRCENLMQARAVATSIEAMEYEAQIQCGDEKIVEANQQVDGKEDFADPYSVQVHEQDWPELARVLDEIVSEQVEFDQQIERRQHLPRRTGVIVVILMLFLVMLWRIVHAFH